MVQAQNIIIGITGTISAGKAALRYFLVDRGFKSIRLTRPIFEEGLKRKIDLSNRENWINLDIELRKKNGMNFLAKKATKRIKEKERYVICPIRHPTDIKYLKDNYNALIIFVDAPFKTRFKRTFLKELGGGLTEKEFKSKDDCENNPEGKDKKYSSNISACKKLSDEIIINNKSLNYLNQQLEKILRKYKIPDLVDTTTYEDFDM